MVVVVVTTVDKGASGASCWNDVEAIEAFNAAQSAGVGFDFENTD